VDKTAAPELASKFKLYEPGKGSIVAGEVVVWPCQPVKSFVEKSPLVRGVAEVVNDSPLIAILAIRAVTLKCVLRFISFIVHLMWFKRKTKSNLCA
jgi:hypothetical protein